MGYYERPKYRAIAQEGALELRQYERFYVVTYKDASDPQIFEGFQTLFRYISKNNAQGQKISMTVPVIERVEEGTTTMAFMVPSQFGQEAPEPLDPRLEVQTIEEGLFAAISYRGVSSEKLEKTQKEKLLKWLGEKGYAVSGDFLLALYNPPFVPGPLRHNEIWVRVQLV